MRFKDWLNGTSMNSFRTFVLTIVGALVLLFFSSLGGKLLLYDMPDAALLHQDASVRAAAQTSESSHHNYGMQVVTAVLAFLTAAIVTGAAASFGDRKTSREHTDGLAKVEEAKERGRVAGTAAAALAAQVVENAKNGKTTKEHAAMTVNADQANITQEAPNGETRPGE
jgi:hypothetical protein